MTRYQILFVVAIAFVAFNTGFLVAHTQTRTAQTGWQHSLDDEQRMLDILKRVNASLDRQNQTVTQLLAEKRARSGLTVQEMDP